MSITSGPALRNQGISDVLAADYSVTRDYASLIREAVDAIGGDLTSDDVRAWIEATYPDARPHHANVIPAVFKGLAGSGRLVPAGWREASRPCARGRVLRVWPAT